MPKWADPFYIIGLGFQLILLFYLIYLAAKLHKYFKTAHKFTVEPDAAAWAKVVMDPLASRRPTEEMVKRVTAGVSDTLGHKRTSPWVRRGVMVTIVILIGFLLFNLGVFAPLYADTPRETITVVLFVLTVSYVSNLSACRVPVVTDIFANLWEGGAAIIWFDDRVTTLSVGKWYEITVAESLVCTNTAAQKYYSLLTWKEIQVSGTSPP